MKNVGVITSFFFVFRAFSKLHTATVISAMSVWNISASICFVFRGSIYACNDSNTLNDVWYMAVVMHESVKDFYCSDLHIPQAVNPANFSVI